MPRSSPNKKLRKTKPNCKGRQVMKRSAFTLTWKNWKPKPWANFVVFLLDPTLRKRSFEIGFNGDRICESPDANRLNDEHAAVYLEVLGFLLERRVRFHKPRALRRRRRPAGAE